MDKFGPELVIKISDRKIGMEGFLVIHNTVLGPGKGGIRMTANVSEEEVYRLAETMTWKNSLAGIPFGGAKAGIKWPGGSKKLKKQFVQSFARAIKPYLITKYIAGPDVNSGEEEMQWFVEAVETWEAATGKPANYCTGPKSKRKCGLPYELGSTGFGVAEATRVAAKEINLPIQGARIAIHGFGNVGTFAYKHLAEMGAKVVLIADKDGVVYAKDGFDQKIIQKIIDKKLPIAAYQHGEAISKDQFWKIPTDVLIPASVTDVINENNYRDIRTKLIVEAGNIPMREHIEQSLFDSGIMFIPDFVANAGGVISSYAEYAGYSSSKMFELVKEKVGQATAAVARTSRREKRNPREVASLLAQKKVELSTKKRKDTFS